MSEPSVEALLSVRQAIEIIDSAPVHPRAVEIALDQAQGLRLAQSLRADRDFPAFDKSLMDGFAVRSADVQAAPVELKVTGEIPAGKASMRSLQTGEAMGIMTGAPLPPGSDGVVPVEDTEPLGERVRIHRAATPGRYIARAGTDCRAGDELLAAGSLLSPAAMAVAASIGARRVQVVARPKVGLLATGDEIIPIDRQPGPHQLRNSNSMLLGSLLKKIGCDVTDLGIARDDPNVIRDHLTRTLSYDVIFVTGGMSMGQYDFVPKVLQQIGATLHITKLRIKPGKPFVFASKDRSASERTFIFGLPGNPVSGFVCTVRLASRLLRRMLGGEAEPRILHLPVLEPLEANGPREFYLPGQVRPDGVLPLKWKGSADVFTLARADALIIRPENAPPVSTGGSVDVLEV